MANKYSKSAPPVIAYAVAAPDDPRTGMMQRERSQYSLPRVKDIQDVNMEQVDRLRCQGFTMGLARTLSENKKTFPLRIWVVDNSGSMQKPDGHRIIETSNKNNVRIVTCTRWEEIRECTNYHIQMAALLEAPTTFRLLNDPGACVGPQQFGIAENGTDGIDGQVLEATNVMRVSRPGGCTPLTRHILEISEAVRLMTPELTRSGQKVVIVIATDGLPTDESGYGGQQNSQLFVDALRRLENLPVWLVVRLCTDEENVVQFYNNLDTQLELSMEVLDDFMGEAEEIYEYNKWLNYALPLHRCREMGYHDRLLDLLDERALTKGELRDFFLCLFGSDGFDGVPDPFVDWNGFVKDIATMLAKEESQWNPIKKKLTPWIDIKILNRTYGESASCKCM